MEVSNIGLVLPSRQVQGPQGPPGPPGPPGLNGPPGLDDWTYLRLVNDFVTTSATPSDVTGLAFEPRPQQRYEFLAWLMVRTSLIAAHPLLGLAWPSGGVDGTAMLQAATVTGSILAAANVNGPLLVDIGELLNATESWPALMKGVFMSGPQPSGDIRIRLASGLAGSSVRLMTGSFLRYRTVP